MLDILSCQKLFFFFFSFPKGECVFFGFIRPSRPVRARAEMLATVPQLPYELEKSFENGQTQMIFDFALLDDTISIDFVSGICWYYFSIDTDNLADPSSLYSENSFPS